MLPRVAYRDDIKKEILFEEGLFFNHLFEAAYMLRGYKVLTEEDLRRHNIPDGGNSFRELSTANTIIEKLAKQGFERLFAR